MLLNTLCEKEVCLYYLDLRHVIRIDITAISIAVFLNLADAIWSKLFRLIFFLSLALIQLKLYV